MIPMKFIQLNVWHGNLRHNLISFLKKENADIINLQEVPAGLQADYYYFGLADKLKEQLNCKYSFYSKTTQGKMYGKTISEGQLILSKYPITYTNAFFVGGKLKNNSLFTRAGIDLDSRVVEHAKIKANGETINVLNYQGYFIWGTKMGNKVTESHCRTILKYMKSLNQDEKIILSGDFNLDPKSKSMQIISKHYPDLVSRYKIKTTRNELSNPQEPVDNILVDDKVHVKSFKVPKVYVSDHLPLIMNFE